MVYPARGRGGQLARDVVPDILRPAFEDARAAHEMQTIASDMLDGASVYARGMARVVTHRVGSEQAGHVYWEEMHVFEGVALEDGLSVTGVWSATTKDRKTHERMLTWNI